MHTDTVTTATTRPLPLRMRPDLVAREHTYLGRHYWVLKDPVSLKYYRFEEEEFAVLAMLDGEASLDDLRRRFEQRFAPQKITLAELHRLLGMLYRSSLVVSDSPDQGRQLLQRHDERRRHERLSRLANVLNARFRGVDPDRFLTRLNHRVGGLFSLPALAAVLLLAGVALAVVATQFELFLAKLPAFHEFFAVRNWLLLAATLTVTKVLHELGHGLACKRFGGECHEMGLMLLMGTPCLYCNVTDSWMLPNKLHRAAIGAAGMYVELILASLATLLWWFSEPGLLHELCLGVMVTCSVSTLVFNANPLMRYDGYYILADLLEIPNLRQKAETIVQRRLSAWLLGLPEQRDPFLPRRRRPLFAAYAVASAVYKWFVLAGMFWFFYRLTEPYGLKLVGQMLAIATLFGLVIQPVWRLVRFFQIPGRWERVKKFRITLVSGTVAAVIVAVVSVPLPFRVTCGLQFEPRDATSVFIEVPGELRTIHARPGETLVAGQPLLTLDNLDSRLEVARLDAQRRSLAARFTALRQRSFRDESAVSQLKEVEEMIAGVDEQLRQRRRDVERLCVRAPVDGTVFSPPTSPAAPRDADVLPTWSGSPWEPRNRDAFLHEGTLVCRLGDARRWTAVLLIDQADVEFVQPGQPTELFPEPLPGTRFHSRIEHVSRRNIAVAPSGLSAKSGGELATATDSAGRERPQTTTYQASVPLDLADDRLFVGATGRAKINAGYQSLGRRCWRYLCRTFRFEL